ncbi:hypothetical protein [Mycolicibacterium obuense]|uniref:hypothetical protein n=1 Tax=Mycolicibacterium obuense TaxID=1807 RepID=UPI0010402F72|nr:hypothetical protein [Mycolicibacterium obuense]
MTIGATLALNSICDAIAFGSAQARAASVAAQSSAISDSSTRDSLQSVRFLTGSNPVCPDVFGLIRNLSTETADWRKIDPSIPAANWTQEQKIANANVVPILSDSAEKIEALGDRSENPVLQDLATLSAQYRRAFALAIPSYLPADNYLNDVANGAAGVIDEACQAVEDR